MAIERYELEVGLAAESKRTLEQLRQVRDHVGQANQGHRELVDNHIKATLAGIRAQAAQPIEAKLDMNVNPAKQKLGQFRSDIASGGPVNVLLKVIGTAEAIRSVDQLGSSLSKVGSNVSRSISPAIGEITTVMKVLNTEIDASIAKLNQVATRIQNINPQAKVFNSPLPTPAQYQQERATQRAQEESYRRAVYQSLPTLPTSQNEAGISDQEIRDYRANKQRRQEQEAKYSGSYTSPKGETFYNRAARPEEEAGYISGTSKREFNQALLSKYQSQSSNAHRELWGLPAVEQGAQAQPQYFNRLFDQSKRYNAPPSPPLSRALVQQVSPGYLSNLYDRLPPALPGYSIIPPPIPAYSALPPPLPEDPTFYRNRNLRSNNAFQLNELGQRFRGFPHTINQDALLLDSPNFAQLGSGASLSRVTAGRQLPEYFNNLFDPLTRAGGSSASAAHRMLWESDPSISSAAHRELWGLPPERSGSAPIYGPLFADSSAAARKVSKADHLKANLPPGIYNFTPEEVIARQEEAERLLGGYSNKYTTVSSRPPINPNNLPPVSGGKSSSLLDLHDFARQSQGQFSFIDPGYAIPHQLIDPSKLGTAQTNKDALRQLYYSGKTSNQNYVPGSDTKCPCRIYWRNKP